MGWKKNWQSNWIFKKTKKHRPNKAEYFDDVITKLEQSKEGASQLKGKNITEIAESIRGYEGSAGRFYFEILGNSLTKENNFSGRSSRPAKDPFNSFLNYAFGVLYSKIEKSLIIAGIDLRYN